MTEYKQSIEEGLNVAAFEGLFREIGKLPEGNTKKKLGDVAFEIICNAEHEKDFKYYEPSDLKTIKKLRKKYDAVSAVVLPEHNRLKEKIEGAWIGRICGCQLGKPVEGIKTNELIPILRKSGNYPMHRYILSTDITADICEKTTFALKNEYWADTITSASPDDDTTYTVLASILIDNYGVEFTPSDVLQLWLVSQPENAYCTAEQVAWWNYINGYRPPNTAYYKNPYREWIGAQIRGDYFGYINPGNPELAAELAFKDASVSHTKNGIYGEMFIAAVIASAAVSDNMADVIKSGLAQIPSSSRFYEKISDLINWYENGVSQDECREKIQKLFDENSPHDWGHVISNSMIVVMALLYNNDYGSSVCSAVQTGFDTDCNGATVGSVFGMLNGKKSIPKEWTNCINNRLNTKISYAQENTVDELTQTTMRHICREYRPRPLE